MDYLILKWLHVMSSELLFGTGLGSAFYMFFTNRTANVQAIAVVARRVVIADWLFTTPTAILQPVTGFYLIYLAGIPVSAGWVYWSVVLYVIAAACWLPVVWLQIEMAKMAEQAAACNEPLPPRFWRVHRIWTALGFPAFIAFIAIFYLMVVKPPL
jgi:uncharacterized membrane protein